jgi:hypothetical protein
MRPASGTVPQRCRLLFVVRIHLLATPLGTIVVVLFRLIARLELGREFPSRFSRIEVFAEQPLEFPPTFRSLLGGLRRFNRPRLSSLASVSRAFAFICCFWQSSQFGLQSSSRMFSPGTGV